jgi:hypothetical protein
MGKAHLQPMFDESISFPSLFNIDEEAYVNFVDHGPGHQVEFGLAAAEWDPSLLTNLNYKHPDAFKLSVLTQGLEEVRAVLAYQLMQK